jgi:hypothetical protein
MNDRPEHRQADRGWGLCASCRHARIITSARGSQFVLCEKSKTDARFARYPALPIVECLGYEKRERTGRA